MDEDKRNAYHEAAHCFAAWRLGLLVERVTITGPVRNPWNFCGSEGKDRTPYYCISLLPGRNVSSKINADDVLIGLDTSFAPAAFEIQKYGFPSGYCFEDIFKEILSLTSRDPEVKEIMGEAQRILENNPGKEWEVAALEFFNKYGSRITKLVNTPQAMGAIEILGDELFNRGRLSGYEAVDILEKAWGNPLPEEAKPARDHPKGSEPSSMENTLAAAEYLVNDALNILHGYSPKNDSEESIITDAIRQTLANVFILNDLMGTLGNVFNIPKV